MNNVRSGEAVLSGLRDRTWSWNTHINTVSVLSSTDAELGKGRNFGVRLI